MSLSLVSMFFRSLFMGGGAGFLCNTDIVKENIYLLFTHDNSISIFFFTLDEI